MSRNKPKWIILTSFVFCITISTVYAGKNIILMISDGAGFNTFDCASYYEYGKRGMQPYDSFPIKLACTTWSLKSDGSKRGYNPDMFWADFDEAKKDPTDSAASATALNTGVKTSNGRICVDIAGNKLTTLAQIANAHGKKTGAISSVGFSHATPACVWAHSESRKKLGDIAKEMILFSKLDLIFGCGHPYYDNNCQMLPKNKWNPHFFGSMDLFYDLKHNISGHGWTYFESKEMFEKLAGPQKTSLARVFGLARCKKTFQSSRTKDTKNDTVPTLETMTRAALNVLSHNANGFYLMIEGGAVDWTNHANNLERMIEEQTDFNHSVSAVVEWINQNSSWEQTLLIVTADHECGQLWGINANTKETPFDLPKSNGAKILPSAKYFTGHHTNSLVPLYAKGYGCELFLNLIKGHDPKAAQAWHFSGDYVDNVDVFYVMKSAVHENAVLGQNKRTDNLLQSSAQDL